MARICGLGHSMPDDRVVCPVCGMGALPAGPAFAPDAPVETSSGSVTYSGQAMAAGLRSLATPIAPAVAGPSTRMATRSRAGLFDLFSGRLRIAVASGLAVSLVGTVGYLTLGPERHQATHGGEGCAYHLLSAIGSASLTRCDRLVLARAPNR